MIILFILSLSIGVCSAQFYGTNSLVFHNEHLYIYQDSLTAERFFADSLGNQYMVIYRYVWDDSAMERFPAICDVVKFKGNKRQTIISNFKAMYTLKETPADNTKLWLKRLYDYQNKVK